MAPLERYGRVLRAPHVGALFAASLVARLPIGINGLAIVLFVRHQTGSFAAAGAAAGAYALTTGVTSPVQGRLIDRHAPRRVLPWLVGVQAAGVLAFVALGLAGAPVGILVALAGLAGLGQAPWSSVMRAMWPRLLGDPGVIQTAFALDAAMIEIVFIAGPLLTALLTAVFSPQVALVLSTVLAVAGAAPFLASPAIRTWESERHVDRHPRPTGFARVCPRALRSPGLRTVVLATVPIGFCFGALEVALPAFATHEGSPSDAGLLIAVWSGGSALGGVVYGARDWLRPLAERWTLLTALLALGMVPLLAPSSLIVMLPLLVLAGACIAPTIASGSQLLGVLAPPAMGTEAYAWGSTSIVVGASLGSAAAGALAQSSGWRAAALAAVVMAAAGAAVAVGGRRRVAPAPA